MDLSAIGRIPPQNIDAEQSVIGSMLLDKESIPTITEILKAEDFTGRIIKKFLMLL